MAGLGIHVDHAAPVLLFIRSRCQRKEFGSLFAIVIDIDPETDSYTPQVSYVESIDNGITDITRVQMQGWTMDAFYKRGVDCIGRSGMGDGFLVGAVEGPVCQEIGCCYVIGIFIVPDWRYIAFCKGVVIFCLFTGSQVGQ